MFNKATWAVSISTGRLNLSSITLRCISTRSFRSQSHGECRCGTGLNKTLHSSEHVLFRDYSSKTRGILLWDVSDNAHLWDAGGGVTWVSPHILAQQGAADITSPAHPASPHKLLHTSCPSVSPLRLRGAAVPWTAQREAATHSARFSLKLLILMQRHSKTSRFFYLDFFWGRLLTDLCVRTVGQIVRKREREPILLATSCHLNTWKWNHAEL